MRLSVPHEWPESAAQAVRTQLRLRPLVSTRTPPGLVVRTAAGLDVSYTPDSDRLAAAVVVLDADLDVVESVVVLGEARFPYLPGLFAFRELPTLVAALERLTSTPDLLVCDGQGLAHPRRFGLACHVGVLTGLPTVGVAKTPLGRYQPPADIRGATTPLIVSSSGPSTVPARGPSSGPPVVSTRPSDDSSAQVGVALRTQPGVRPVFVSVGHRIDLDRACAEVLRLAPRHRLPETTRHADHLSRQALR